MVADLVHRHPMTGCLQIPKHLSQSWEDWGKPLRGQRLKEPRPPRAIFIAKLKQCRLCVSLSCCLTWWIWTIKRHLMVMNRLRGYRGKKVLYMWAVSLKYATFQPSVMYCFCVPRFDAGEMLCVIFQTAEVWGWQTLREHTKDSMSSSCDESQIAFNPQIRHFLSALDEWYFSSEWPFLTLWVKFQRILFNMSRKW